MIGITLATFNCGVCAAVLVTEVAQQMDLAMLSIGHLTASLSEKGSGVKMVVEQLSAASHKAGHRVKVFGFDEPGREIWKGAEAQAVPLRGPKLLGYAPAMGPALAVLHPQIVHAHGLWLLFANAALHHKQKYGTPYVYSPHGMLANIALEIKPWRKRIARTLYQDRLLQNADCLVATSDNELRHIRDAGLRGPVALIPLGIEDATPAPQFPENGEKHALYIGRKLPLKGLEVLALAWKDIAPFFPDWKIQIIGPDSDGYETLLSNTIAREGIPRLDLLPAVAGAAREAAYCESQFSILPSTTENFALTVGESLIRRVPVIATRATPWSGLEHEMCGMWIEGDRKALADTMARMMSMSAAERYAMGCRGRDWILRDFQWPELAERHHALYRWVLGQQERPDFVITE